MLDSLTFIVLLFHFCPIYLKKKILKSVYNSRHLNQKGKKKKSKKRYRLQRESWAEKRKKKKEEEERRRRKKEEEET
jgi:ABC-type transporter lipoprotein component MlaA